jgi:putative transposase
MRNQEPVCRLYREIDLRLRNKLSKRRVKAQLRKNRSSPTEAKQIWDMYFVHDQLHDGKKICALTIFDICMLL